MADLLNAIIGFGGTTAIETPLTRSDLIEAFIDGPHVVRSHVAVDPTTGEIAGFQALERDSTTGRIDIATFARMHPKIADVGTSLFGATRWRAGELDVSTIVAQIRSDNHGGVAYHDKMGFRTFDASVVRLLDGRLAKGCPSVSSFHEFNDR